MIANVGSQKIEEREKKHEKSRSAKKEHEKSRSAGAQKRERKSAKFKAQKRARKHQREELRQRARKRKREALKIARAQLWIFQWYGGVHSQLICTNSILGSSTCHQASQQGNNY